MKSFNRLRQLDLVISNIINENNLNNVVVADIGTDHGYLAELLSRNEKISLVLATDISQKCLDKTNKLIKENNLQKISTILGDGLDAIEKAKIVVAAGIGGYEIIKMLSNQNITKNGENKCDIFVFQPSKNVVELRQFLIEKKYKILHDFIIFSGGKFYPIICVNLGVFDELKPSIENVYFGRDNSFKNQVFIKYLKNEINKLSFIELLDKKTIENDEDLKLKFKIFNLAKSIVNKNKGD